jgi:tripartite-type tricarboxylate transporter receptor subunit TctC
MNAMLIRFREGARTLRSALRTLSCLAAAALAGMAPFIAQAQQYPVKPIRIIVGQ